MVLSDSKVYWKDLLEFLSEEYPNQLEFAERIYRTKYAKTWFPSTSHGALVLSPTPKYEDFFKHPSIAINNSNDDFGRVSLTVSFGDSSSQSEHILPKEEAFQRLISFLESYDKSQRV